MFPNHVGLGFLNLTIALAAYVPVNLDEFQVGQRIVGGKDAKKGEFPYQVTLQQNGRHFCGGSIIDKQWILTAGHCVRGISENSLTIKAGKNLLKSVESSEQSETVAERFVHERYVGGVAPYDIALLKLQRPLKMTEFVKPVGLPKPDSTSKGTAILSGWGSISNTSAAVIPDQLQKAVLPVFDFDACKTAAEKAFGSNSLHYTNICTGPLDGKQSSCSGDSGGPLVQKRNNQAYVIGIVSWGAFPCGSPGAPSVYVKVSSFIDWIQSTIKK